MITNKIIRVTRRHVEIDQIFCDWCEEEIKDKDLKEFKGYGKVNIEFGFGSCYDEERFQYHICDRCFEILKKNMDKTRERINKRLKK
jgi:hypothetical protein